MNHVTAFDIVPGQTWRHEVTQADERQNAVVREVSDGFVRMYGHDEPIPIGNLLAYWRWVS